MKSAPIPEFTFKTKLFTQSSVNAIFLTGIGALLMHPFVVFGYHFPDMGFLVWFFLVPLMVSIHRLKFKHKFILCFLSGMLAHYGILYWFMSAMQQYGGLSFFSAFAAITMVVIALSFLFALPLSLASWIGHFVKIPLFVLLPVFLLTRDVFLSYFPWKGFPWTMPAYALGQWVGFFQWVDSTGVLGLSLFIYIINSLFASGILLLIRNQVDKMISRFLVVVVLMFISFYASSLASQHYEKTKTTWGSLNIALIQGNIPQDKKWDAYYAQSILDTYLQLTTSAIKDGAQLVVWPETSYPFGLRFPKLLGDHFLNQEHLATPLLFGAFVNEQDGQKARLYNSVIQVDRSARMIGVYRKMHLVPFGEYLPMKSTFKFLESLTQEVGEFDAGNEFVVFSSDDLKIGSLICFEDIFPENARAFAQRNVDVLMNYTNDAWYGNTSAQHQHLVFSQFRALETRRFLFRATNTGMTAVITPRGEVFDSLTPFKESYLLHNIKIDKATSFYTTYGHNWAYVLVVVAGLIIIYAMTMRLLGPVEMKL